MTISRSNIPKQITTGGRKMMKNKGYRMGGKIKSKGRKKGGKVKVMSIAQIRAAANKKGYKLVKK